MEKTDLGALPIELVRIIEAGIERQLNCSIIYSPFKLFYFLFKRANLGLYQRIREVLAEDIEKSLLGIAGFSQEIFIQNQELTTKGNLLMKRSYNIGIRLIKNQLGVKKAFRVLKDPELQQEVYNYILDKVVAGAVELVD